jgi:hypothetical protein
VDEERWSCFRLVFSVLYAVSGATKQAWALAPQALELSVYELAYSVMASVICIICSAALWLIRIQPDAQK